MCAAGMGSNACASGCTSGSRACSIGGVGADVLRSTGSPACGWGYVLRAIICLDHQLWMAPTEGRCNSTGSGWTKGDATATPIDKNKPRQHEVGEPSKAAKGLQGQGWHVAGL